MQFDVTLDSLPFEAVTKGFEVVVQLRAPKMHTNRTFWTDSNGLGMINRVLDKRLDYNITEGDAY